MNKGKDMNPKKINPRQRDFFNERAAVWDEITVHNHEKVRYITELLGIRSDDKILGVGTGTGVMIPFYENYLMNGSVVAVDYSEKMIEVARLKYPENKHPLISYLVKDIYELNFDADFDLVVCYSCFPHFVDQHLALKIFSRSLRKGGRLMVAHSDSAKKINGVHMNGFVEVENDFLPRMEMLKQMMYESGF